MTTHRVLRGIVLALVVLSSLMADVGARRVVAAQDPLQRLYDDTEQFDQLSGAARSFLERRFGKRQAQGWLKTQSQREVLDRGPVTLAPRAPWEDRDSGGLEEPLTSIGNILVNGADATAFDTQSETTLVLGAGSTVIVGFNDSGSLNAGNHFTGFAQSTDGGTSFVDRGTLLASTLGDAGDPVLSRDATSGTIYFSTLAFSGSAVPVFRSTDNGGTFGAPVNGAPGFSGGDFLDKEWITVDNFPGSGIQNVYLVFRNFAGGSSGSRPSGVYLTRSTDGGATWTPSGGLPIENGAAGNFTQGAFVTVGPDHAVYVFYNQCDVLPCRIMTRKSTDLGLTFGSPVTVVSTIASASNGDLGLEFRTNTFAQAVLNPANGHVYVAFNDNTLGSDRADVFLMQSTDGGSTWSTRVRVNDDATSRDQWFPTLAVTPDGSRVFMSWYDRRLDPVNAAIDVFGAIGSVDGTGAVSFGPNFRITGRSFPAVFDQDPVVIRDYMGDYDQAVADNDFFYVTWGDNRLGNFVHPRQPDVRFARIPVNGPGPVFAIASTSLTGGNGNGIIDTNECNTLSVTLQNLGTAAATGVSATLAFNASGITVAQAGSAYPDIAVGATGTNVTPFQLSTSPGFVCGTNLDLTLTVTTAAGDISVLPFGLSTGAAGTPVRFDKNTPLGITDNGSVESTIAVSGITTPVRKVTVSLYITHTFDADLIVSLIGPDNTQVPLTSETGGSGDNYGAGCSPDGQRTTFDDAVPAAIYSGTAPFVGTFRPAGSLAAFVGKSGTAVNDNWKLRVSDVATGDIGILQCWSLFLSPATCATGSGTCALPPTTQPKLANISTRGIVGTGNDQLIGGLIVVGTTPKTVLLRGRGPSLGGAPFFIPDVLNNPLLRLFSGSTLVGQNDNWQDAPNCAFACGGPAQISATGLDPCQPNPGQGTPPPNCALESAILVTLPSAAYTFILSGAAGQTGVGLVEAFEVDGNTTSANLHNIATRGVVGSGNNIMIGGVIIDGPSPKQVLIRGRGPSLGGAPFSIPGVLADPSLDVFSGSTPIAHNNNWQDTPSCDPAFSCGPPAQITASGLDPCQPNPGQATSPPNCAFESAVLITLPPGAYTMQLSGVAGQTGVGLVEVFEIPF